MIMKKFGFIAAFVMVASVCAQAQEQKFSKWTVTPRVGMNVSNLVGGKAPGTDSKIGFTGGADVEYRPIKLLGISAGCFFNTQNSALHINAMYRDERWDIDKKYHTLAMQNIAVPLLLNAHVWNGLTVKAGVQFTRWTRSRGKYDADGYVIDLDGEKVPFHEKSSDHADKMKTSMTMPIAVAYEYKNIELDVRYLVGAYKLSSNEKTPNHHPKSLVVTLGYKFGL